MVTKSEGMQRVCLFVFSGLAVIGIAAIISGLGSAADLASRPDISADQVDVHYDTAMVASALLLITGIVSGVVLWRSLRGARITRNALHLVLGLGLLTLLLMILVGELGWEIAHHELGITSSNTPQVWSHIHIILNHFPTVGFVFAMFFFIYGLVRNNDVMKRGGLVTFVICAILGVSTYVTGASAMWALTDPLVPGINKAAINVHRDWALMSLFGLAFTGVTAWIELWRYRYIGKFSKTSIRLVLLFSIITLALLYETGKLGGQINHPELRVAGTIYAPAASYWSPQIESLINNVIWFVPWQTVHFFGYTLVFAVVVVVALRVLGFWKSIPFSAVHRLLPLGVFAVTMNVFTGMLMLMADTSRYVNEVAFWPKMFFLPIGAMAVLYFSLSDDLWKVKAGEDAPMVSKWVSALVLVSWTFVIMGGRLLPYLGRYGY